MSSPDEHTWRQRSEPNDVVTVVLAGGEGRRLEPLTQECCKPALPFAGRHRTIDFTLSNCLHSHLPRVAVLAQYQAASLTSYLDQTWRGRSQRARIRLETCLPDRARTGGYSGTADAVAQNLVRLELLAFRRVLVLAGDHVYRMDYRALLADHIARGADITVACVEVPQSEAQSFGVVAVDGRDRITGFEEKPLTPAAIPGRPGRSFVSMGIYVFESEALAACLRDGALDFGRDILPHWVGRAGIFVHRFRDAVHVESSYWRDVGTIDAYWQAHMELLSANAPFDTRDPRWPLGELRSPGPHADRLSPTEITSELSVARSPQVHRSAVSPCARIGERAVLHECIVLPGGRVGSGCRLTKVIVGHDCHIPEGVVLGEGTATFGTRSPGGVTVVTARDLFARPLDVPECVRRFSASAMPFNEGVASPAQ